MTVLPVLFCAGLGLLVTVVMILVTLRHPRFFGGQGQITQYHHSHQAPVSRMGGLALVLSFVIICLVALLLFPDLAIEHATCRVIFVCSLAMFGLGFWDDLKPLGARRKLLAQGLIAAAACYGGIQIQSFKNPLTEVIHPLGLWGPAFTVFWLVSLTNLINLIDGIDGLAGGISLMLMCVLCYSGQGAVFPALVAAGMAGALLGFLRFNFPPAKIYMGDGGAYLLGFLIASLSAINSHKGTIATALIAPLLVLALPIIDVSTTILRRGLVGLPLFRADRKHIHHRLVELGFSRTRAVLTLCFISLILLVLALFASWSGGRAIPLLCGLAGVVLLVSARSFKFSREWLSVGRVVEKNLERRKVTQYALVLGRWLEMEADRCDSMEGLWLEFQFMARKLGFARVKLTLADGAREWEREDLSRPAAGLHAACLPVHGMTLEFTAQPETMNHLVFVHLCDLASEAWHKAVVRWNKTNHVPISFGSRIASDKNLGRKLVAIYSSQ